MMTWRGFHSPAFSFSPGGDEEAAKGHGLLGAPLMGKGVSDGGGGSSDESEEEDVKDWSLDDDSRTQRKSKARSPAAAMIESMDDDSAGADRKAQEAQKLQARKKDIIARIDMVGGGKCGKESSVPQFKGHWAEVLKEVKFLGEDFVRERVKHGQSRKKLGRSILTYFRSQGTREERMAREQQVQIKKQAARVAREVKGFWIKINRLVSFRQKVEVDEARKKAMDKHLAFLVQQTERYASMVAKNMLGERPPTAQHAALTPISPGARSSTGRQGKDGKKKKGGAAAASDDGEDAFWSDHEGAGGGGDTDYSPDQEEDDDEDDDLALQEEEERHRYKDELEALQRESNMPVTELKKLYTAAVAETNGHDEDGMAMDVDEEEEEEEQGGGDRGIESLVAEEEEEEEEEEGEEEEDEEGYEGAEEEDDEEDGIAEQEALEREGYDDELHALAREGDLSVEELRKLYYGDGGGHDDDEEEEEEEDGEEEEEEEEEEDGDKKPAAAFMHKDKEGEEKEEEEDEEASAEYARYLTEELEEGGEVGAPGHDEGESGDEYNGESEAGADEEEEIGLQEEEEKHGYSQELEALKREADMTVEELRALYYDRQGPAGSAASGASSGDAKEEEDHDDHGMESLVAEEEEEEEEEGYEAMEEDDEEDEIAEQEALERDGYEEELDALAHEGGLSVEELRKLYYGEGGGQEEEEEGDGGEARSVEKAGSEEDDEEGEEETSAMEEEEESEEAVLARMEAIDDKVRSIAVDRPFILSPALKLREYQQAGLNWLVSLYERRLNGILADEMGLGKTIQTIALLAFLASQRGIWGPHLVVVPTSCIVNWESEFKRWCPAFKILTYYGSALVRKNLRQGWSKPNSFHIVITSYQLVVQDASSFKRKKWFFLILDEAHNIKNFKSQRWQTLLNFNSHRRLLLTGTPLQNDLMELWSLMHFLMPHVFRSRKEFSYWFSNPLNNMVEGTRAVNDGLIRRLHTIVRPFLLRRLKRDVEKQLPAKYEHTIMCPLSRRQLHLYEEFMSRSSTRAALAGGNFMGMMNVLMQLRKVCNHPDLFEPRPIVSPYSMSSLVYHPPTLAVRALDPSPLTSLSAPLLQPLWPVLSCPSAVALAYSLRTPSKAILKVQGPSLLPQSTLASSDPAVHHHLASLEHFFLAERQQQRHLMATINKRRCGSLVTVASSSSSSPSVFSAASFSNSPSSAVPLPTTLAYQAKTDHRLGLLTVQGLIHAIKSDRERAVEMEDVLERFTFIVPRVRSSRPIVVVGGGSSSSSSSSLLAGEQQQEEMMVREVMTRSLRPFHVACIRQTLCFPDRWLVQYDAGKLQILADMLRKFKRGGHRCLIFTQMTKMLDVLESFLNLHGHSYLRLDGATGVDKRQKLMDRFNNDPKIFCFILSTRSGGLGINLTGADTVIFYDSDWNPAMDAQAQDRAHRIGQTREVHIYRLVSEKTIEENILKKARQRRQLDFLAITAGKFTPEQMYNQQSLREMLDPEGEVAAAMDQQPGAGGSAKDVQDAMNAMEDEADLEAMRGAQKENIDEMREFDDSAGGASGGGTGGQEDEEDDEEDDEDGGDDDDGGSQQKKKQKKSGGGKKGAAAAGGKGGKGSAAKEEQEPEEDEGNLEEEDFAAWSSEVGPDLGAMEARLNPVQRYALKFRTVVDPFRSLYFISEEQRRKEAEEEQGEEVDMEALEAQAAEEEAKSLEEGEILATAMEDMSAEGLAKHADVYKKARARASAQVRSRRMTGENWCRKIEVQSGFPFWYNTDTGEAQWEEPKVITERDAQLHAREKGYAGLPLTVLSVIMSCLSPAPDRIKSSLVCRQWRTAAWSRDFFKRVLPVEVAGRLKAQASSASSSVKVMSTSAEDMSSYYLSVAEAVAAAKDGETIVLEPGHHWVEQEELLVTRRIRLFGESSGDSSRVVVELTGTLVWKAKGGVIQDLTIRRPKPCPRAMASVAVIAGGLLDVVATTVIAESGGGVGVLIGGGAGASLFGCSVTGAKAAGVAVVGGAGAICKGEIARNGAAGVLVAMGSLMMLDCRVTDNKGCGVLVMGQSLAMLRHNDLTSNHQGSFIAKSRGSKKKKDRGAGVVVRGFKNLVDQGEEDLAVGMIGVRSYKAQPQHFDRMPDPDAPRSASSSSSNRPYTRHQGMDNNGDEEEDDLPLSASLTTGVNGAMMTPSSSGAGLHQSRSSPSGTYHTPSSSAPAASAGVGVKRSRDSGDTSSPYYHSSSSQVPASNNTVQSAPYQASAYQHHYQQQHTYPAPLPSTPYAVSSSHGGSVGTGAYQHQHYSATGPTYQSHPSHQHHYSPSPAAGGQLSSYPDPYHQQPQQQQQSQQDYFGGGYRKPPQDRVTLWNPANGRKQSVLRKNVEQYCREHPEYVPYGGATAQQQQQPPTSSSSSSSSPLPYQQQQQQQAASSTAPYYQVDPMAAAVSQHQQHHHHHYQQQQGHAHTQWGAVAGTVPPPSQHGNHRHDHHQQQQQQQQHPSALGRW